jgi:NAD(P)-dependent dehydrogenase (short-subunit alcohol dehydrogenase family)
VDLLGRTVFITGAARGIGAQLAREVARRGAQVAAVGLEPDRLEALAAELGPAHLWHEADVTEQASLDAAVAATVERLGGIDVVVANAGVAPFGTVLQIDPDAWAQCVEVNLTGVFRTIHAALPHVAERRGYVLAVSSLAAFASTPGLSAYDASKRGVEAFTEALRLEVAHRGIAVGCAHPSWIDTDLVRDAEAELASFRELRKRLPWPVSATTSVEDCALALADAIEARAARVCVPREVVLVGWLRQVIAGPVGRALFARDARASVPRLEAEIAALGRSFSARTHDLLRSRG